jgi:glycosyltransferase involved in cell wall biosynthesis
MTAVAPSTDASIARVPSAETTPASEVLPFVSVIIPMYNDAKRLVVCLEALEGQSYPPERYEVVVVDNASTEPVAPLLSPFAHVVPEYEASPGSYAARNRGMVVARGEVLAFTDADCIPGEDWIEAGVSAMTRGDAPLVAGRIDVFPERELAPNAIELYEMTYAFAPSHHAQVGIAATANLFTRRKVMDEVGGFDPALKSFGDVAWTARAVSAGYEVEYCDSARVRHPARRTLGELRQRYARFAGGHYDRGRRSPGQLTRERIGALLMLAPPARLARRVLTSSAIPDWHAKAGVIGVAYFARLAYLAEWARLELGGASRRQ